MNESIILIIVQLISGAVATILAILYLPRTRNAAWIFIIIAVILNYGQILIKSLEMFGIIQIPTETIFSIVRYAVIENVHLVFISVALLIAIIQKRS